MSAAERGQYKTWVLGAAPSTSEDYGVRFEVHDRHGKLCLVRYSGCDSGLTVSEFCNEELSFYHTDAADFAALLLLLPGIAQRELDAL